MSQLIEEQTNKRELETDEESQLNKKQKLDDSIDTVASDGVPEEADKEAEVVQIIDIKQVSKELDDDEPSEEVALAAEDNDKIVASEPVVEATVESVDACVTAESGESSVDASEA